VNSIDNTFGSLVKSCDEFKSKCGSLLKAMAACHSLTFINQNLSGDPLDLKMFEFTKWTLLESSFNETNNYDKMSPPVVRPPSNFLSSDKTPSMANTFENNNDEVFTEMGLIRQFPFSSSLQRMSVIVKELNATRFNLFTKGSPEKIFELSRKETSIRF
jgi:cation-transporting ATPase 13A2